MLLADYIRTEVAAIDFPRFGDDNRFLIPFLAASDSIEIIRDLNPLKTRNYKIRR
jgi:hypothetical protein